MIGAAAAFAVPSVPSVLAAPPMLKTIYTEDEPVLWGPFKDRDDEELEALEAMSQRPDSGRLLASGTRVIDLVVGDGREPVPGDRIYCIYKVWANGFRAGPAVDWTYFDGRPYDWTLGQPTDRIPSGVDAAIVGMREGGWRRMVVPAAYLELGGLRRINPIKGGGRFTPAKAGLVIQPGAAAYFDLIMLDGGSGRCDNLLRPKGVSVEDARKRRSKLCLPGDVRVDGVRLV